MNNFQVGDKVRVKTMQKLAALYGRPIQGIYGATIVVPGGFNFTSNMEQYGGTIHTIEKVFAGGGYHLSSVNGNYTFTDAMLDRVGG
ncbi:MAG: hypothetical protein OSJ39_02155 [Clostridia bacterium]|nr:hypothetical protein [Clostridia bacterium]